jgi:hypothetical protein
LSIGFALWAVTVIVSIFENRQVPRHAAWFGGTQNVPQRERRQAAGPARSIAVRRLVPGAHPVQRRVRCPATGEVRLR